MFSIHYIYHLLEVELLLIIQTSTSFLMKIGLIKNLSKLIDNTKGDALLFEFKVYMYFYG